MRSLIPAVLVITACGSSPPPPPTRPTPPRGAQEDPEGAHKAAITAQFQPLVTGEIVSGIVVGLYDGGKREIYGFGKGPDGKPPTGTTLFEIGSITKVYTSLLLADAIQRREVSLDTPLAELLPPGVTAPTKDKRTITLRHLATHSSGLPRLPPTIAAHAGDPDPYAHFGEDALYHDLVQTELEHAPGEQIVYSNYGAGLLGFVLGRKLGPGYAKLLQTRILDALELRDTFLVVPAAAQARRAQGTTTDLAPTPPWTFDALAGAGALVSDARDQLALIDAELDAAAGGKQPLRAAMRLTQEPQLENTNENEGLGWQIDDKGRYWHNGGTGGFHCIVGFDPKLRRGVVILSATSLSLVDRLATVAYAILNGDTVPAPATPPTAAQLAPLVGKYELAGTKLEVTQKGARLFLGGPGVPTVRLVPFTPQEYWIEQLQSVAAFEKDGDKITRMVFAVGDRRMSATRVSSP